MSTDDRRPEGDVRGAILADLTPVRPLKPPLRRALVLLPIGLLLLIVQPLVWGVRDDAPVLGVTRLWGLSLAQSVLGVIFVAAALREAVPGRMLRRAPVVLALGLLALIGITLVTWLASPTLVPSGYFGLFWRICFSRPVLLGLPVVGLVLLLAWRAYPMRAALVGALAGLGAGLMTDAGWRTFCHVSDPLHVLTSHTAAVIALCAAGASLGAILQRRDSR
jgi:hypothetical protein